MNRMMSFYVQYKKIIKPILIFLAVLGLLFIVCLIIILSGDVEPLDVLKRVLIDCLYSSIVVLVVLLINNLIGREDHEKIHNQAIATRILGLLKARKDKAFDDEGGISHLFSDDTMAEIMANSASHFAPKLAEPLKDYIISKSALIYSNFEYDVEVMKGKGHYMICQTLRYTRFFKSQDGQVHLYCCFTFGENQLDKYMSPKNFFHEEIIHPVQIQRIQDIVDASHPCELDELINALHLHMSLDEWCTKDGVKVPSGNLLDIRHTVYRDESTGKVEAILFDGVVPKGLHVNEDGMCGYRGHIECKYMAPQSSRFLCVFVNPIIDSTRFAIMFDRDIVSDIKKDVDFIKLISAKEVSPITYCSHTPRAEFRTEEAIFPRSGICVNWKTV
ncbi:MAG: hypothetical protein IKU35_03945 [Bacteroidaceae bacterium]|nr:hypothetical protein [Bacteroidaceae bacterium]